MKENIKLLFSATKTAPIDVYQLKLAIKRKGLIVEFQSWMAGFEAQEAKAIEYVNFAYREQLFEKKTIVVDFTQPILVWMENGQHFIAIGKEEIDAVIAG